MGRVRQSLSAGSAAAGTAATDVAAAAIDVAAAAIDALAEQAGCAADS